LAGRGEEASQQVLSHQHGLIGQPAKPVTKAEMRRHVGAAVEMFLSHFAA